MSTAIIVVVAVLLLLAAFRLWLTANRLDRLHLRTQAAWAALDGALSRRIVAARALAATGRMDDEEAATLRRLAVAADAAPRADRDAAETALSTALAAVPPDERGELAAELSDAAERVLLARRFYNDAVRDTRGLRASWFTRFFRLAGRAGLPDYFELPEEAGAGPVRRTAGRVVLVDGAGRTLVLRAAGSGASPCWFTPGGGVLAGEDLVTAALRELAGSTGLHMTAAELVGPIWRRTAGPVTATAASTTAASTTAASTTAASTTAASTTAASTTAASTAPTATEQTEEFFFVAVAPAATIDPALLAGSKQGAIAEFRWLTAEDLRDSTDPVHPFDLAARLPDAERIARTRVAPDIPETIT